MAACPAPADAAAAWRGPAAGQACPRPPPGNTHPIKRPEKSSVAPFPLPPTRRPVSWTGPPPRPNPLAAPGQKPNLRRGLRREPALDSDAVAAQDFETFCYFTQPLATPVFRKLSAFSHQHHNSYFNRSQAHHGKAFWFMAKVTLKFIHFYKF